MGPLHHIPRQGIRALEGLVCCLCGQVAEIEPPRVVGAHDQRPARSTSRADEFTALVLKRNLTGARAFTRLQSGRVLAAVSPECEQNRRLRADR
jgi:hypothetical protein